MRTHRIILAVLPTLASATALAGDHDSHSSDDDLTLSSDGGELNLHSSSVSGVTGGRTTPSLFHGLKTGDVIEAIGDHKVARVEELLKALQNQCGIFSTLHVRRAGTAVALTWKHSECQALSPPFPPLPPPPPATPVPPEPPAPPRG